MASGLAATGNQAPVQLNQYLSVIPEKSAARLHNKALVLKTIAIITMVAVVAIVGAVLAVAIGLGAVTGMLPFVLLGLAVTTPFLAWLASKLKTLSNQYSEQSQIEKGVAEEYDQFLLDCKTPKGEIEPGLLEKKIEKFFAENNWSTDKIPMDALRLLNPKHPPLCALLPLVARYNYFAKQAAKEEAAAKANIVKPYQDPDLRYQSRKFAYDAHERMAIPMALEAAFCSAVLQNPAIKGKLLDYVILHPKSIDARLLDRQYDQDDVYITYKEKAGVPITLTQLEQNLDPKALRQWIPV